MEIASAHGASYTARSTLCAGLEARRLEIQQEVFARIGAISDLSAISDPCYVHGLRAAISAAIDYAIDVVGHGEERAPPLPLALLAQARVEARSGISLDTVLRRCFACYLLFEELLTKELEHDDFLVGLTLAQILPGRVALFDRLLDAVSEEYAREAEARQSSTEQHRVERIERLLAGEPLDTSGLAYDFDLFHTGFLAISADSASAIRDLAEKLECRLLLISQADRISAWLGDKQPIDPTRVMRHLPRQQPHLAIALGEPAEGLAGWRFTHFQAAAALPLALHGPEQFVRYADVALLSSVLRDELLIDSLQRNYLAPLTSSRRAGGVLRETLRAYFSSDRNVSSAAAALGVSRQTVSSRLREIEEKLGRTMSECAMELEIALRVDARTPCVSGPSEAS